MHQPSVDTCDKYLVAMITKAREGTEKSAAQQRMLRTLCSEEN